MTRQIICITCAKNYPMKDYPGEWWVRITGKARGFKERDFVCDMCNETIPKGARCVAQSNGLNRTPYYAWEHEFLGDGPGILDGTIRVVDLDELAGYHRGSKSDPRD